MKVTKILISFLALITLNSCNSQEYSNLICVETEQSECLNTNIKKLYEVLNSLTNVGLSEQEILKQPNYIQAILGGGSIYYEDFYVSAYHSESDFIIPYFCVIEKNKEGESLRKILDFKIITGKIDSLTLAFQTCELNEEANQKIIALVVQSQNEYRKAVHYAWEANPKSKKLESISIKGIYCPNEGF